MDLNNISGIQFWLDNPSILLNKHSLTEWLPLHEYSFAQKLNAITRTIVLLTVMGYVITKSTKILVSAAIAIMAVIILYKTQKDKRLKEKLTLMDDIMEKASSIHDPINREEYTNPTPQNPLMNMLPTDEPTRKPAAPSYNKHVHEEINDSVDNRLFADLGDNINFERCMRNFHTMPNTTMPNGQKEFAEFCYGDMHSAKEKLFENVE